MALASLILGILSIIISLGHPIFNIVGVLAGLAGVVLGYFSRRRFEKRPGNCAGWHDPLHIGRIVVRGCGVYHERHIGIRQGKPH